MAVFRILSIDGGGLRGIIPVLILKEIERRTNKKIIDQFDMIAGTSTGGLITCALAVSDNGKDPKFTISDIEKIYIERGKEIFPQPSLAGKIIKSITSLKNPKYSAKGIDRVLKELLLDKRITDCIKPIFIPTYDLNYNEAILFKSRKAQLDQSRNSLLYDVCRSTSAGPTYLPAYDFSFDNKNRTCIDGGVFMNNPSVGAIVEASKYRAYYNFTHFDQIQVLSLGTGHYTNQLVKKKVQGFGALDWAVPISDVMMQGVNQTTCYEAEELLEENNFLRVSVDIDNEKYSDMADSKDETRNYLINLVNKEVIQNEAKMKEIINFLQQDILHSQPV